MNEPSAATASSRLITRLVGWTASVFYRLEHEGGPIPDGPILVVANHPNSLLDPLILFRVCGRPTRPLAKAPLFDQTFVGLVLRGLGGLPVFRRHDDPAQMHRNEDTFRRAMDALQSGDAVQIYPEGLSHSEPSLAPLRTGAARIALGAEAERAWTLGLRLVPVGLTYRHKPLFRGNALARIGEPFTVTDFRDAYERDQREAVRALTDAISNALEEVTLNLTRSEDRDLIETAERLYVREKGDVGWREREPLAERLPRLQTTARALAWMRAMDAPRYARLAREVRAYRRALTLFGASEADVPPGYTARDVMRYVIREGGALAIGLPFAMAGTAIWYAAYAAPRVAVRIIRPDFEAVATYKLATGFVAMPLTWAIATAVAAFLGGLPAAFAALIGIPLLGFVAIGWWARWRRVREDAGLFLRVLLRPRGRNRLTARRAALVREFDDVLAAMARSRKDDDMRAATAGANVEPLSAQPPANR